MYFLSSFQSSLFSSQTQTVKLAGYLKSLAQQAKNVPKYLPAGVLKAASALDWSSKTGVAGRLDRRASRMESTPESKSEKPEKSYLSTAVDSISPWGGSRSSTPKPASATVPGEGSGLKHQRGGDHTTQNWHGFSSKRYPPDCPPLNARWFHAVDVCPELQSAAVPLGVEANSSTLDTKEETQIAEEY